MKRNAYNKSVVSVDGEPIPGLKRRPNRGRFYAKEDPKKTFGADAVAAFVRFAQWRWEQKRNRLTPREIKELPNWFPYGGVVDSRICPEIAAVLKSLGVDLRDLFIQIQTREYKQRQKEIFAKKTPKPSTEAKQQEEVEQPQSILAYEKEELLKELDKYFPESPPESEGQEEVEQPPGLTPGFSLDKADEILLEEIKDLFPQRPEDQYEP